MGVNLQTHRRANVRQVVKNVERYENLIADAADVYDHFAGLLLRERAADLCDHVEPCNRVNQPSARIRGINLTATLDGRFEGSFRPKPEFIFILLT